MKSISCHRSVGRYVKVIFIHLTLFLSATTSKAQAPQGEAHLSYKDREQWRKVLGWPEGCEQSFGPIHEAYPEEGGIRFYDLGHRRYLVMVECYRGAYIPGELFMIYDEAKSTGARLLKLKGFDSAKDEAGRRLPYPLVYGEATFYKKSKVLEILSKYNGPGSCGLKVKYHFRGARPEVIEAREKKDCFKGVVDPNKWPRRRL